MVEGKSKPIKAAAGADTQLLDTQLEALLWLKKLKETNNEAFIPLFFEEARFLVLCGGGGSGKSIFAGRKVLERVTTEPGHRFLVCRKVGKTLRQSCFTQLLRQLYEHYPDSVAGVNKTEMTIRLQNGSEILFTGLDDVEKLKSIYDITGIWIEEASELDEGDLNQLDIRLRANFDYYLQIILSFNPISITHWLKARFFDRQDPRAVTHRSTYKDNRFLNAEAVATLESFKEKDEYFYTVYALGEWGVTGKTIFDAKALTARLAYLHKNSPLSRQGDFTYTLKDDGVHIAKWEFTEAECGICRIYKEPEAGRPYVIGADAADEGSDYFAAQVLDNITGEQVAVLRHQYSEDTFACSLYCLGIMYNGAMLAPEVNYSTYPIKLLRKMRYPGKMYVREVEDTYTGRLRQTFGFKTTSLTRPIIIAELVRVLKEHPEILNDETTILELLTFVKNEKLRPEAEAGAHDDTVLALAIAHYVRPQQSMQTKKQAKSREKWTADMLEDYRAADAEGKKYLEEKWGKAK